MSNVVSIFKNKPAKPKTVLPPGNPYRKIPSGNTPTHLNQKASRPASQTPPSPALTENKQALTQLKTSYNNLVQLQSRLRFMLEELENSVIKK